MSIAAPMLVISLIIYAGLFGLFIYLVILIIRALKKYQTTMSISGRASRKSYFMRLSSRSAT